MVLTGLLFSSCKKEDLYSQYEGTYRGSCRLTEYKPATGEYSVVVDPAATAIVSGTGKGNIAITVNSVVYPSPATLSGRFYTHSDFSSSASAGHAIQTYSLKGSFSGDTLRLADEVRYSGNLHYSVDLIATRY